MTQFFQSYLAAYLMWLGLPLGCLVVLMIHHLAGGRWGYSVRRVLEAATRTLPWMALLFIPVGLGMHHLFPWTHPEHMAGDELLQRKAVYLNVPFFLVRAIVYFATWIWLSRFLNRCSDQLDERPDAPCRHRLRGVSAVGLGVYGLTVTFAAVDWVMSLDPHWFSTIFGMILAVGQVLSGLAVTIAAGAWLARRPPLRNVAGAQEFHDLGNLLLTFVILWAYVSFSQYLIIWSGNIREEVTWYHVRGRGLWLGIAVFLAIAHFAVPFVLLLWRDLKRDSAKLGWLAAVLLVLRQFDMWWFVVPSLPGRVGVHWLDVVLTIVLGAVWFFLFARQLRKRPLVAAFDARIAEAEAPAHG